MLEECLLICRHYESLQWHINTVRPTGEVKAMDGLTRPRSNTKRPPLSVHPDKPKNDCTACGTLHQAGECPASSTVCFKCNKQGHHAKMCHSKVQSTTSMPNSNRNTRDLGVAEVEAIEAMDPNVLCIKLKQLILQNL